MDSAERPETPGTVFGEVAEQYDAARPGYAQEVAAAVLPYADLGDRPAVEIGAGTGKTSVLFAAHGIPLVCVEPDPRMAEVLHRTTARYPQVQIQVSRFEQWEPGSRRFGLLFAATSWHWLDPERRWELARAAVKPGGAVALFWNPPERALPALLLRVPTSDPHDLPVLPRSFCVPGEARGSSQPSGAVRLRSAPWLRPAERGAASGSRPVATGACLRLCGDGR